MRPRCWLRATEMLSSTPSRFMSVQITAIYTSDFRGERGILGPVMPHSGMPIDNLQFAG
jgi:hypothetical protein